jgi:hypothetical protein
MHKPIEFRNYLFLSLRGKIITGFLREEAEVGKRSNSLAALNEPGSNGTIPLVAEWTSQVMRSVAAYLRLRSEITNERPGIRSGRRCR